MKNIYVIDIAKAWLETLLDVIDLLPKDVVKKDVSFTLIPVLMP